MYKVSINAILPIYGNTVNAKSLPTKTGQVKFITSPSLFHTLLMEKAAVEETAAAT